MNRVRFLKWSTLFISVFVGISVPAYGDDPTVPQLLRDLGVSVYPDSSEMSQVDSLDLSSVVHRVLALNPRMRGARSRIDAATGRVVQAGVYANPEVAIDVEDVGRASAGGPSQTTIGMAQPLVLWGKRSSRRDAARAGQKAASAEMDAVALDLYRQAGQYFAAILGAQQAVIYAEERLKLATQIESVVQLKLSEGAVPRAELLRAQAAVASATIVLDRAHAERDRQKYNLSTLWGQGTSAVEISGELNWVDSIPSMESLADLLDEHPILQELRFRVDARRAELRFARALGRPDVTLGAGYRRLHDAEDNSLVAGVALPIPLFDRNRGGIREAEFLIKDAEAELEFAGQSLQRELYSLWRTLENQTREMNSLSGNIVPASEEAFRQIDEAYRLGRQPYINVLDAQRTLAEAQSRLAEVMILRAQTAVQIESLTGRRLTGSGR